jgi:hypothetical protein
MLCRQLLTLANSVWPSLWEMQVGLRSFKCKCHAERGKGWDPQGGHSFFCNNCNFTRTQLKDTIQQHMPINKSPASLNVQIGLGSTARVFDAFFLRTSHMTVVFLIYCIFILDHFICCNVPYFLVLSCLQYFYFKKRRRTF